jgi:hypothetical protein
LYHLGLSFFIVFISFSFLFLSSDGTAFSHCIAALNSNKPIPSNLSATSYIPISRCLKDFNAADLIIPYFVT